MFARFGTPDTQITDNGPQFAWAKFRAFAKTHPPMHSQMGKQKMLFRQSRGCLRNAIHPGHQNSMYFWTGEIRQQLELEPAQAQRLFEHWCKTLLPVAGSLLQPSYPPDEDTRNLIGNKEHKKFYCDKHSKPLEPITAGDTVRLELQWQDTWTPGTCLGQAGPRTYAIKMEGVTYWHNRQQLISTGEPQNQPANACEASEWIDTKATWAGYSTNRVLTANNKTSTWDKTTQVARRLCTKMTCTLFMAIHLKFGVLQWAII